jgi:ABC-type multidrug transport system permease subunit
VSVFSALLAKDLRRARRNPLPWLALLAVPLLVTALIGAAFSPRAGGGGLGTVTLALVDEDDSTLTRFLRRSLEGREHGERLDVHLLNRGEAMRRIGEGELAAVVIVPRGFTRDYLAGRHPVALELVKNPAQAIHPAVVEEALGLLVEALNALAHVLGDELAPWAAMLDGGGTFDWDLTGRLISRAGDRLAPAKAYLSPPLISYRQQMRADASAPKQEWSLFAFLLVGMGAMFLLYIADNATRDLYRELRFRTLERFRTLREGLWPFVAGKAVFAIVAVLAGAAILLGGGALVFGFAWRRPLALAVLVLAYAVFAAGFMGLLAALAGSERRAEILNNVIVMVVSMAGGCMFPPQQLPAFLRERVMPAMPTAWFTVAARSLQDDPAFAGWAGASARLGAVGVAMLVLATVLLRRRLERGARA